MSKGVICRDAWHLVEMDLRDSQEDDTFSRPTSVFNTARSAANTRSTRQFIVGSYTQVELTWKYSHRAHASPER